MALSQCLEDSPLMYAFKQNNDSNIQELYNERHRLALEELVSGGIGNFLEFLRREQIQNFLSDKEIRRIVRVAVVPRCYSVHGDDIVFEQSITNSIDCSTVTYFPEVSDIEPPLLEIGWPAFTAGSYRGVTRAVAHFQPSYGECIYSCKEAARRMIKSAKEVIAIVTDSLTDLDIFKDLQEICSTRRVPVYILLDQSCAPAFLKLCGSLNVHLDELRQMRVRTITGGTYFMRSGVKITGKVHERFMLIDGNRVATGSYRFNWTDGKLNSSNLIELSGQITESFDEEFRILYAQSLPLSSRGPPSARNSGIFDHLLVKRHAVASPLAAKGRAGEAVCLTSTPSRGAQSAGEQLPSEPRTGTEGCKSRPVSDSSTLGEDWTERQDLQEDILSGNTALSWPVAPAVFSCHVSTQTCCAMKDVDVQTDPERKAEPPGPSYPNHMGTIPRSPTASKSLSSGIQNPLSSSSSSDANSSSPRQRIHSHNADRPSPARQCAVPPPDSNPRDSFRKLTKERQRHYSAIRSKLEHMVTVLSQRRELADLTNMTPTGPSTHHVQKSSQESAQAQILSPPMDAMGTWPRARCLH